uniref:Peptidase A1 domain-containing protein n=1 Tax=Leersia perrieri TaxID=77586 RepID=A0A0D9XPU8_9ORYZ
MISHMDIPITQKALMVASLMLLLLTMAPPTATGFLEVGKCADFSATPGSCGDDTCQFRCGGMGGDGAKAYCNAAGKCCCPPGTVTFCRPLNGCSNRTSVCKTRCKNVSRDPARAFCQDGSPGLALTASLLLLLPLVPPSSAMVFKLHGNVHPYGYFFITMNIGDPGKSYSLDIDTDSTLTEVKDKERALNVCWKGKDKFRTINEVKKCFRSLSLKFAQGDKKATLEIPPEHYLIISNEGHVCLGILDGSKEHPLLGGKNLIGGITMLDQMVIYDSERALLGWVDYVLMNPNTHESYGVRHDDRDLHPFHTMAARLALITSLLLLLPLVLPSSAMVFQLQGNVYPDGHFFITMNIGDPVQSYYLDIDTGSTLTWLQCDAPCVHCNKVPHLYKPKRKNLVNCADQCCTDLYTDLGKPKSCGPPTQCDYEIQYVEGSSSGVLVVDRFSLPVGNSSNPTDISFGCGYDQGKENANVLSLVDGVLGLGRGRVTLLSQLKSQGVITKNVMGHCISSKGGGFLFLGDAEVPASGVTWFPLNRGNRYYSLGPGTFHFNSGTQPISTAPMDVIFDSGATYTYFASQPYQATLSAVKSTLNTECKLLNQVKEKERALNGRINSELSMKSRRITMLDQIVIYDSERALLGWVDYKCDRMASYESTITSRL